jgi:hypothetical protein
MAKRKLKYSYTKEEYLSLLNSVNSNEDTFKNAFEDTIYVLKDTLNHFLNDSEETYIIEVYEDIYSEARLLEMRAEELRSIARLFRSSIEEMPKKINDDSPLISTVATWRLSLGR